MNLFKSKIQIIENLKLLKENIKKSNMMVLNNELKYMKSVMRRLGHLD